MRSTFLRLKTYLEILISMSISTFGELWEQNIIITNKWYYIHVDN